jgi:hypothetical protein
MSEITRLEDARALKRMGLPPNLPVETRGPARGYPAAGGADTLWKANAGVASTRVRLLGRGRTMGTGEEGESYRLKMLRYLKAKYSNAKPSEVLEAERVIAKFREEEARDRAAVTRLSSPLPEPDMCQLCWFLNGVHSKLHNIPADDPAHFERWKCRTCGDWEDRRTGPR